MLPACCRCRCCWFHSNWSHDSGPTLGLSFARSCQSLASLTLFTSITLLSLSTFLYLHFSVGVAEFACLLAPSLRFNLALLPIHGHGFLALCKYTTSCGLIMSSSPPPEAIALPPDPATPKGEGTAAPSATNSTTMEASPWSSKSPGDGCPPKSQAVFSTHDGAYLPRKLIGPPFPPVIVRSDKLRGVVDSARHWQKKYKQYCLCIFPQCGWEIEDFWDEVDMHIEGAGHLRDVLNFISRENFWQAKLYAGNWSLLHPELVASVVRASNVYEYYAPKDPLAIVDRLFKHGESDHAPRAFLWHVAHIMRMAVHEVSQKQCSLETSLATRLIVEGMPDGFVTTEQLERLSSQAKEIDDSLKGNKMAGVNQTVPSEPSKLVGRPPTKAQLDQGPHPAAREKTAADHIAPPMHVAHGLHERSRIFTSGALQQPMPHPENVIYAVRPGFPSRSPSGTIANMSPPVYNFFGPPPILHTSQGPSGLSHPTDILRSQQHNMPNIVPPPQQMYGQASSIIAGPYPHYHAGHVPRNIPFEDVANGDQNSNGHCMESWRAANRRGNAHSNGALYDPYNGTKPAFNEHTGAKRSSRHNYSDNNGRQRKSSAPGNRPMPHAYGPDRPQNGYHHHVGFVSHTHRRGSLAAEDPAIVGDSIAGCGLDWIGPENSTVNELYMVGFVEGCSPNDILALLMRTTNITPTDVNLRHSSNSGRPYALVT